MRALPPAAIAARHSTIHGRGVYARRFIPAFTFVTEYTGERIPVAEVKRREKLRRQRLAAGDPASADPDDASCDYLFLLDDGQWALDGRNSGHVARLINHSCEPNCCTDIIDGRIWIISTRDIAVGDELSFDYGYTLRDALHNPCRCGTPACVGYIIARDQRWRLRRHLKKQTSALATHSPVTPAPSV